jgi:hypothetical protein
MNNTITVTPIYGFPTAIKIASIKEIKHYREVYHHQVTSNEISARAIIILDANITGDLVDERIQVEETIEEVKAMMAKAKTACDTQG